MSDFPNDQSFSGSTPGATLYYLAHISAVHEASAMWDWLNLPDVSASAAAFTRDFTDMYPEQSLDHLLPQHFVAVNQVELRDFALKKGTKLQVDRNPFGTLSWLEYQLPAVAWPGLPADMHLGSWIIQTDGVHILASLTLPEQLSPALLRLNSFPRQVTQALQDEFSAWNLDDERLALGWNWHGLPASRPLYGGVIYQLPDTGLVMSGESTLSSSIQTYVGTDLTEYLPMILADTLTLRFTTRILSATLNQTGSLAVNPDDLPLNLDDPNQRRQHQTKLLESWRRISEMQRTLDAVEDVLLAGRAWITSLEGLKQRGFRWKPTGPLPSPRMFLHGPYDATMEHVQGVGMILRPSTQISLSGRDLPVEGLKRVIRNVDQYRVRLGQQAATVKEGVNIQNSLMSARSAEQSTQATITGLKVARIGAVISTVALLVALASLTLTVDWSKVTLPVAPSAESEQGAATTDSFFGVSYPQRRSSPQ
ncbi:hypothetical protein [Deinococcus sp. QL22]|uniref:hypothetical protein n=1 Tax=Deinococcus sp. QL22 TaxID=2939437 RepID=UPI002016B306|nr:hypothetical protein [Deinococcus sp. QL22]UQN10211.1 hypothetical protein M1R55_27940 [Deinococcus sp. QL22]